MALKSLLNISCQLIAFALAMVKEQRMQKSITECRFWFRTRRVRSRSGVYIWYSSTGSRNATMLWGKICIFQYRLIKCVDFSSWRGGREPVAQCTKCTRAMVSDLVAEGKLEHSSNKERKGRAIARTWYPVGVAVATKLWAKICIFQYRLIKCVDFSPWRGGREPVAQCTTMYSKNGE